MKRALLAAAVLLVIATLLPCAAMADATLTSDKPDYHPGETVTLIGTGFQPGETVTIVLYEEPITHEPAVVTSIADAAGNFTNNSYVVQESDGGVTFTAIATGDMGSTAQTTFTDSEVMNSASVTYNTTTVSCPSGSCAPAPPLTVPQSATISASVGVHVNFLGTWQSTGWRIDTTAGAVTCVDTPNHGSGSDSTETFNITAPSAPGTYNVYFIAYSNGSCSQNASNTLAMTSAVTVAAPAPNITSAASTTFSVNTAGSFTVTATGSPAPTFSQTGALPSGVTFTPAGLLSGTPAAGTSGTYPITITATNGVLPDDTQSFTLTVANIALRGSSTNVTTTTPTSLSIAMPADVVAGDVMIVNIAVEGQRTISASSAGWTLIDSRDIGGSSNARRGTVLYRVAAASETGPYVFALGTGTVSGAGGIVAFSGVDSSVFDVAPGTITVASMTATSTSVSPTAIITASASAAVIMFGQSAPSGGTGTVAWSNWTTTSPGTLTEIYDIQEPTDASVGAAWAVQPTANTSTGTSSVTVSTSFPGAILIALKPAVSTARRKGQTIVAGLNLDQPQTSAQRRYLIASPNTFSMWDRPRWTNEKSKLYTQLSLFLSKRKVGHSNYNNYILISKRFCSICDDRAERRSNNWDHNQYIITYCQADRRPGG